MRRVLSLDRLRRFELHSINRDPLNIFTHNTEDI